MVFKPDNIFEKSESVSESKKLIKKLVFKPNNNFNISDILKPYNISNESEEILKKISKYLQYSEINIFKYIYKY